MLNADLSVNVPVSLNQYLSDSEKGIVMESKNDSLMTSTRLNPFGADKKMGPLLENAQVERVNKAGSDVNVRLAELVFSS